MPELPSGFSEWLIGDKRRANKELEALVSAGFRTRDHEKSDEKSDEKSEEKSDDHNARAAAAPPDDLPHRHLQAAIAEFLAVANCTR